MAGETVPEGLGRIRPRAKYYTLVIDGTVNSDDTSITPTKPSPAKMTNSRFSVQVIDGAVVYDAEYLKYLVLEKSVKDAERGAILSDRINGLLISGKRVAHRRVSWYVEGVHVAHGKLVVEILTNREAT